MKTQISRDGFRADRRYSGVYQQQGRLITDSDWNELVDIVKDRLDQALVDVVGSGSPKGRAAAIQISGGAPKIVPGVIYAGGVEARVAAAPGITANPFDYDRQADFPSPPPPPANSYRLYADVWERPVVALEDDGLRDPALHGADTCTRTQTMAQIKWSPLAKDPANPADNPGKGNGTLTVAYPQGGGQGGVDPCDPQVQEVDPIGGDFLLRVEVHDARWPANVAPNAPDRVVVKWSRENGAEQFDFEEAPDWFKAGPWLFELFNAENEKHQGFHLSNHQTWTPKRATLTPTLPQAAPAGVTSVRRWDGYVVLVRTGNSWGVSGLAGEIPAQTAPGAAVGVTNGKLTVGLADLELALDVAGKVFLPGDSWSVPVRRATYLAGQKLLDAAQPSGVLHRYVVLAEVQGDGSLRPRTVDDERRLAFPRLTELGAPDIGYTTTCTSGLFDATHNTVKKALDRLCAIAAQHVGYQPPGPTSVYRDRNPSPNTVAKALDLLADVHAKHVLYTTAKDPNVGDVEEALNALFDRQAGSGNRITVGKGGDFGNIADAISALQGKESVALALMPGEHGLEGFDLGGMIPQARLSLLGLGLASRIRLTGDFDFRGIAMLELDNVAIDVQEEGQISVTDCPEISIKDCWFERSLSFTTKPLVLLDVDDATGRVQVRSSLFDVQPMSADPNVGVILQGLNEDIPDLFAVGLSRFLPRVKALVAGIAAMTQAQRNVLAQGIRDRIPNGVSGTYHTVASAIDIGSFNRQNLEDAFDLLRRTLARDNPGTALVLQHGRAATLLEGNEIRGRIGLYGPPSQNQMNLSTAWSRQKSGINTMGGQGADLQLRNNRLTGIRVSDTMIQWIQQFNPNNTPVVFAAPIFNLVLTDNRIDGFGNTLVAKNIKLSSTNFTGASTDGWILGEKGIYVGTHGEASTSAQTALNDLTKAASTVGTLNFTFTRFP